MKRLAALLTVALASPISASDLMTKRELERCVHLYMIKDYELSKMDEIDEITTDDLHEYLSTSGTPDEISKYNTLIGIRELRYNFHKRVLDEIYILCSGRSYKESELQEITKGKDPYGRYSKNDN